ncbi:Pls/PosA family non-ribosomal peptide synthetase [Streptomyces chiangmaiensis]|uniref:Pls/PosA family non-ribosomal peptide synthetase n=1 Tax=Streptomyces chiangmaiensis TaxID=766497 RepID=A0ABU7FY62_9ACTN|nr:Pls/PosA family non-ribosomal peptide synthetase [Streptomyces chiangmaiensis]MED7828513.1 Pls/PosA family non-ribosomal peptide synthetase [Streptomyces chiangmaiensis]
MVDNPVDVLTPDPGESSMAVSERVLAEVLAEIVRVDRVSVDSNFFSDLGADSMVMAHFCARLRKRDDAPSVSMKDVYRYPTVRNLAAALTDTASPAPGLSPPLVAAPRRQPPSPISGASHYVVCGALQLLLFLAYIYVVAVVLAESTEWIAGGVGLLGTYLRAVLLGAAVFLGASMLPVVAKWVLIGRWRPQRIRIWSLAYFRFWCVKTLIRSSPLVLFVGSPLYPLYLRALGAKIGRRVSVFSRHVPVCTDLLTIGDGSVVRKDTYLNCYRAESGVIRIGPVTLGKDVLVGEMTVLDIDTAMGDRTQLGHASSLHAGQVVPDGERWHGSPAQPTEVDYRRVGPARCGSARRALYSVAQVLAALFLFIPLVVAGVVILMAAVPQLASILQPGPAALTGWTFYANALAGSAIFLFGAVVLGVLLSVTVPRVLNLILKPGIVYPLYGVRYAVHRAIVLFTNRRFFTILFGDSSGIVHYLLGLGYKLSPVEQTGSNFGMAVKHDVPYLSCVGQGTMVADGLSIINADFSPSSFRVSPVTIGPHNFVGNYVAYPAQGRTGDNCLLATKVMVPLDGAIRENVGLLGSPSFQIPRTVLRDSRFDHLKDGEIFRHRLAAKTKHNALTMGVHLFSRWLYFFCVTVLASAAVDLYHALGAAVIALAGILTLLCAIAYMLLTERATAGRGGLRPLYCSIYEQPFWRHERYWKITTPTEAIAVFNGTPYKSLIWRLLGTRIGSHVFDDGCFIPERSLVTIGNDCTLNEGSRIQCHSQEDGTFKSDRTTLGNGCTIGVNSLVHYGVTMGDTSTLAPDSFLMKGEQVPTHAYWAGNPARETPTCPPAG